MMSIKETPLHKKLNNGLKQGLFLKHCISPAKSKLKDFILLISDFIGNRPYICSFPMTHRNQRYR